MFRKPQALVGPNRPPPELVRGRAEKTIEVECLLPEKVERLAWSGHIGVRLVPLVLERIRQATSTIIFTNTRAQAEIWYRAWFWQHLTCSLKLPCTTARWNGSFEIVWNRC